MSLEIKLLDDIENGIHIIMKGVWERHNFADMLEIIETRKPDYLVLDPTESILPAKLQVQISETDDQLRVDNVRRIIRLMQENPHMLYIIINRNDTAIMKTAVSLYEEAGIADRYIFVPSFEEARDIIANHQAKK